MLQKVSTCGFIAFVIWGSIHRYNSEKYELLDSIPSEYHGDFVRIFQSEPGDLQLYDKDTHFLSIAANHVSTRIGGEDSREYEVLRVHRLHNDDIIIFYGKPRKGQVAQYSWCLSLRPTNLVDVDNVLSSGGETGFLRVGTYQPVRDYAALLGRNN